MASKSSTKPTLEKASTLAQSEAPTPTQKFEGHEYTIQECIFLHDNVHIVSGSWDGTIRKWNYDTGFLVGEPWRGKGGSISAMELSPNGKIIACGREDGSLQGWNIDGNMIEGVWTGHSDEMRSLSWSPSGGHIASGSGDGTILIQEADGGKVKVGVIKTKQDIITALAYSPSGDRIASGGSNKTICIWNVKTGKLVVGPIKGLGDWVNSMVWSKDGTKIYSASDRFARVLDAVSGRKLHRFEHHNPVNSVALSSKNNVLACVGYYGVAQLWDTESHQPLGQPFCKDRETLRCVSFSRDGSYVACGGGGRKLTLWMLKDIAPELAAPLLQQDHGQAARQNNRPESPSSACLDADATGGDGIIEEEHDDPYNNFFQSQSSLPSASAGPHQSPARRFWNTISRNRPPANESIPQKRPKRSFFGRRARSNSLPEPATITHNQPAPEAKVRAGQEVEGGEMDNDPGARNRCKGKEREGSLLNAQSPPHDDPVHPAGLDSSENRKLWQRLIGTRGKDSTSAEMAPATKRPEVVEVYAVRGFQRYVALTPKWKKKSPTVTYSAPLAAAHASGSSPAGPSLQGGPVQPGTSLQAASGQGGSSSPAILGHGTQPSQATGGPSSQASPSHFVAVYHTNHDSDSRSSIEGSFNRFLDKICFPCGHYHEDS